MADRPIMRKVLALDLLCPIGHVAFDSTIIDALGQNVTMDVAVVKEYFGQEPPHGASVVYEAPGWLFTPASGLCFRVKQLFVALYWALRLRLDSYDAVLVLSYETISFSLVTAFVGRKVILFAFCHNNLDELSSKVKLWFFRQLSRRVHHLVFEPYMVDAVYKSGGPAIHASVVPFPMRHFSFAGTEGLMDNSRNASLCCVGPSGSNDESFIEWMIQEEASTGVLQQHDVSLTLHSKNVSFDDGWLHVYHRHLDDNEYETLLCGADVVVLPYPRTFENRVSGVLLEALACRRHWIGTDTPIFRHYAARYPMLGQVCKSHQELLAGILQVSRERLSATPESAWDSVNVAHSRIAVAAALVQVLESSQ